jgi:thiamine-phosphate pyrophosphorylase
MTYQTHTLPARFYPIAPDYVTAEVYILAGIKFLQIRLKELSDDEIKYQLKHSVNLAKKHDCHLVINDFWEYAIALKADWLHLGQEDLLTADIIKIKSAGLKLGISTHDIPELQTALVCKPDYIALGPVYFTKLKAMQWQPQGLNTVSRWKKECGTIPLVAIGGITLETAFDVLTHGADCVSFVTDITQHETPNTRLKAWIETFNN